MTFEKELEVAERAADLAAGISLRYQAQGVTAEEKADFSPVTVADRECEKAICEVLLQAFPGDGILGEEGAARPPANGRRWIIDPIDGTRDFVRGNRQWGNLIGLEVDGEVTVGVVNLPALGQRYTAIRGKGAWSKGKRLSVSKVQSRNQAVLCLAELNSAAWRPYSSKIMDWVGGFWAFRCLGGCPDAMMVASGSFDIYMEPSGKAWDVAAVKIVVEEAGGRYLNFNGGSSIHGGNSVYCTPGLEQEARRFLGLD